MESRNTLIRKENKQNIVILGGGFAGIRCALDLAKKRPAGIAITLITNKPFFLYYPAMYRVATGSSPLEAQVPLSDIFGNKDITIIEDTVVSVDTELKKIQGKQEEYSYDILVMALGNQPNPVPFPNLENLSFNFLTMHEAMRMRGHIDDMFAHCEVGQVDASLSRLHFVVVGAGASGVEVTGELASYARYCAACNNVDESLVTIDVVDRNSRVVPRLSEQASERVARRLRSLGVNIFANRGIKDSDDADKLLVGDMEMTTKTIIWTAGTRVNEVFATVESFERDERQRIMVDDQLRAIGHENIFVLGDAASTPLSGLAQTAIHHGAFAAKVVRRYLRGKSLPKYRLAPVFHSIPVGPKWGVFVAPWFAFYGRLAWYLRHLIDIRFYFSILPFKKAWRHVRTSRKKH